MHLYLDVYLEWAEKCEEFNSFALFFFYSYFKASQKKKYKHRMDMKRGDKLNGNLSKGKLIVRTFTALGTVAVPNATVTISTGENDEYDVVLVTNTDASGVTPPIELEAIPIEDTTGKSTGFIVPHKLYSVEITKNGFNTLVNHNVPVYENQTSIQTFNLIPSSGTEGAPIVGMEQTTFVADRNYIEVLGRIKNESGGV